MPVTLTPRERRQMKGRAHALEPVVQVGHAGASINTIAEVERALAAHELVKVKILDDDRDARVTTGDTLAARTDAAIVGRVGKILILWRPTPEDTEG